MDESVIDVLEAHREVNVALDNLLNEQIRLIKINREQQKLIDSLTIKK
jgi:hypothetical protein